MTTVKNITISMIPSTAFGIGVFFYVWSIKGPMWAVIDGVFWPVWLGYHVASIWVK
jgi:hypothetical protein